MLAHLHTRICRALAACLPLLVTAGPASAGLMGPQALAARHAAWAPQEAGPAFGAQLQLDSTESRNASEGDVYAVLEHNFARVSAALSDPGQWCEILILHLNTKHCRRTGEAQRTQLDVRVGRKAEQPVAQATPLKFSWRASAHRPDYVAVEMQAPEGPYDTSDYRLVVEAMPLPAGRTFLHMGYAFAFGGSGRVAMKLYLATIGRGKVGFTVVQPGPEPQYVGGVRGVVERNTMRYYLAIDAYLSTLDAPPLQRVGKRYEAWFDATERYPRQLHEVERADYLRMKHNEYQRQTAQR